MVASPNSNIGICGTLNSGGSCDINCHCGNTRSGPARRCSSGTLQNGPQSCRPLTYSVICMAWNDD